MKRKKRLIGFFCLLLAVSVVAPSIPKPGNVTTVQAAKKKKNGLKKEKGYYRYYRKGKLQKKKWMTIKRKKYYFKKDGNAAVGSCKIGKKYYIFNAKGQLATTSSNKKKIITVNGIKYQVKGKGFAAQGWSKDKIYYFGANGKMLTGIRVFIKKNPDGSDGDEVFYCFGRNGKYDKAKTKQLRKAAVYEKDMTDLYRLIGKPRKSVYTGGSCFAVEGLKTGGKDGELTYKNFTVYTYKDPDGKEVYVGAE